MSIHFYFKKRRGLFNFELEKILAKEKSFIGCFSQDDLPTSIKLPVTMIINTANKQHKGKHWIAVRINKKSCLYFDTFGLYPIEAKINHFLQKFSKKILYSSVCIQNINSYYCGFYCIAFIKMVKIRPSIDFCAKF